MAQINVGFTGGRSSSRVLKPPGGETSDIFGINEIKNTLNAGKVDEAKSKKNGNVVETTKVEAPKPEEPSKNVENVADKPKETPTTLEAENIILDNLVDNLIKLDPKDKEEEKQANNENKEPVPVTEEAVVKSEVAVKIDNNVTSNKRPKNRVPPGGYSSGLW